MLSLYLSLFLSLLLFLIFPYLFASLIPRCADHCSLHTVQLPVSKRKEVIGSQPSPSLLPENECLNTQSSAERMANHLESRLVINISKMTQSSCIFLV